MIQHRARLLTWLSVLSMCVLVGMSLLEPAAGAAVRVQFGRWVTIFLGVMFEALPFLLAGVLVSALIHVYVSAERIQRTSPRAPFWAALTGAFLGLAFPVCECGSVPAARRLLVRGAPLPLGIAFVLAAPVMNPLVIASTWIAFRDQPWMVAARLGLTLLVAVIVALVLGVHAPPATLLTARTDTGDQCDHPQQGQHKLLAFVRHVRLDFLDMSRLLVIGAALAAVIQTLVPRATLLSLGQAPVVSVLALMILALVLSICSTADAFVALSFVNSFLPGSILAFLVFGPMIDVKSIFLLSSTFQRRTVALTALLTFQLVLLVAVAINLLI